MNARNGDPASDEDGCVNPATRNMGTYIHGIFDNPTVTAFWLQHIGLRGLKTSRLDGPKVRNREYDLLAEHLEKYVDVAGIEKLVQQ